MVKLIDEITELAETARKGGLLSLEGKEVSHPFLQKGITLLVDGHDHDVIHKMMIKEIKQAAERHHVAVKMFKGFGELAPAMGMVGTLIGLIAMMGNMGDPKSIGPAMATALLGTMYGAVLGNLIGLPLAEKLEIRMEEEKSSQHLILDAVIAIQSGQNPRVIKSMLQAYINEKKRPKEEA